VVRYKQVEDGFSNPNGPVNKSSLDWLCASMQAIVASRQAEQAGLDLLELYCGNGNHTVALAAFADSVVSVELNKALCDVATENLRTNNVYNAKIVHCGLLNYFHRIRF